MDGWINGWTDGQMDRQMIHKYRYFIFNFRCYLFTTIYTKI